jgi:hypothetical protein
LCAKMPKMMVFVELLEAVKNKPNSKLWSLVKYGSSIILTWTLHLIIYQTSGDGEYG